MRQYRNRYSKNTGFTLIEVLIALAIFSIGFMAMGALQTGALMRTGEIARKTEAWTVLEEQTEDLKAMPFYANDNDEDDDDDGVIDELDETDPLLQDTQASPAFDQTAHDRLNGRYQVHWRVQDDVPIAQVTMPPDPTDPAAPILPDVPPGDYTVSKSITIVVTRDGGDPQTDALARTDFIKVWAADSDGIP